MSTATAIPIAALLKAPPSAKKLQARALASLQEIDAYFTKNINTCNPHRNPVVDTKQLRADREFAARIFACVHLESTAGNMNLAADHTAKIEMLAEQVTAGI